MTNQQSAKLSQPRIGLLHDPATLVAAQLTAILIPSSLTILPVQCNQLDVPLLQSLAQRIRIVSGIRYDSFRFLPGTALRSRHADLGERGFRKRNFMRRGTFQPNSQRNTFTSTNTIHFVPLPRLVLPTAERGLFRRIIRAAPSRKWRQNAREYGSTGSRSTTRN
jgi:hypothetical protein